MGVEKKYSLPVPTETSESITGDTDVGSRLTERTEKTSYSLAEGNTVTIPTLRKQKDGDGLRSSNKSQTSLLIECKLLYAPHKGQC